MEYLQFIGPVSLALVPFSVVALAVINVKKLRG